MNPIAKVQNLPELLALPEGTVIIDSRKDVWRKYWDSDDTWYTTGNNQPYEGSKSIKLPAEVLHRDS